MRDFKYPIVGAFVGSLIGMAYGGVLAYIVYVFTQGPSLDLYAQIPVLVYMSQSSFVTFGWIGGMLMGWWAGSYLADEDDE